MSSKISKDEVEELVVLIMLPAPETMMKQIITHERVRYYILS